MTKHLFFALALLLAAPAWGQVATPTQTPTSTPTQTWTPRPNASDQHERRMLEYYTSIDAVAVPLDYDHFHDFASTNFTLTTCWRTLNGKVRAGQCVTIP